MKTTETTDKVSWHFESKNFLSLYKILIMVELDPLHLLKQWASNTRDDRYKERLNK